MTVTPRPREPAAPPSTSRVTHVVRLRVSLRHGDAPGDGLADAPFHWSDVLTRDPPRPIPPGAHRYAIAAEDMTDASYRVEDVVLARVLEGDGERIIELEHVIAVQERALAPAIQAEEDSVGARVEEAEENAREEVEEHEANVRELEANGSAGAAVARSTRPLLALKHRVILGGWHGLRTLTRGAVTLPDKMRDRWKDTLTILHTDAGRKRFRHGLTHPQDLHAREKAATLFVSLMALTATLILLHFVVTLAAPGFATQWRTILGLFTYGVVTSLGAPLPIEPLLFPAAASAGRVPVILLVALAKVVAAYLVFFLGDEVNDRMTKRADENPRFAKWLQRSEWFARRFGAFAMALFIAIPGLPDVIALYVFGSLGMKLWKFLLGVAVGGLALYSAILFGVGAALGL